MGEQLEHDLITRGAPPENDTVSLGSDLIWGVATIAVEIGRNPRQTFHILENGKLPAAKVGGRWCASRSGLRQFFANLIAGEVV
jgi:hypothetical protein